MVGVGSAKLVLSFGAWKEGQVAVSERQLSVVAPAPGLKREAVSSRLRQSLVHPDKSGVLVGLTYSADGRRIFAGHNRSGIVQVWDATSGRQLTTIETGPGSASFWEYFQISPDGRSLYVNRGSGHGIYVKGKDKRLIHYDFSGSVRVWHVETGKSRLDLKPAPGCGIVSMQLSPDGSTLFTRENVSGDYEPGKLKGMCTLWDARTGQRRVELPENHTSPAAFSPDSQTLLTNAINEKGETTALLFLDAANGKVRRSIPIEPKHQRAYYRAFSPDGKRLVCDIRQTTTEEHWIKCRDVASGSEIASFPGEKKDYFREPVFSPDGRILALTVANLRKHRKLYLIDTAKGKPIKSVALAEEMWFRTPVFSSDGKWIAILSQTNPTTQHAFQVKVEDLPQPRILLIEAATGEVRETIVAPPAKAVSPCFSPDGKTLASGGDGRVLLWDMTKPPGTQASARE